MRSIAVVFLVLAAVPVRAEDVPSCDFNRIDHGHPRSYLDLPPSIGSADRIRKIAAALPGKTPEDKLVAISRWMENHLRYDAQCAYAWRDFDSVVDDGRYGGCADHAVVYGALARACGIPCVWVKTMDIDWIREFRANHGKCRSWRGHVFLEVYLHDRWMLLDASQLVLYEDYRPTERILPGNRYAYDKGGDPYALVLSPRWELWKKQTARHFADFDLSRLPLATQEGRNLGDQGGVFVAADNPIYKWIATRCTDQGYRVRMTFNTEYARILPRARGNYLILTYVDGRLVLDPDYYDRYLPWKLDEIRARVAKDDHGVLRRKLADGTRVILLFGSDRDAIRTEISRLTLDAEATSPTK
jgi:transglutaminase-like putative cysteine protease